jgi:carboxyl-terminal processing protease
MPLADRKVFVTDTGRKVYGGGGITPDIIVKPAKLSRTTQLLEVRSAIFNYAIDYSAKHPEVTKELTITPQMLDEFTRFAAGMDVATLDDIQQALKLPADHKFIERSLRAEIIAAKFGLEASYPFRLDGDDQIERALAAMPQSDKLASNAAVIHAQHAVHDSAHTSPATAAVPNGGIR